MRRTLWGLGLFVVGAVGVSGCVVTVDNLGDYRVQGEWLINGETPTTTNCAAVGITSVAVIVKDGPVEVVRRVASCQQGTVLSNYSLLWDIPYTTEYVAYDSSSNVVAQSTVSPLLVSAASPVDTAVLLVQDFRGASTYALTANWTLNGEAPTDEACTALGVADIRASVSEPGAADPTLEVTASCADGTVTTSSTLVLGTSYEVVLTALDSEGAAVGDPTDAQALVLNTGSTATLAYDVVVDAQSILVVNFGWDTDTTAATAYGDCSAASVATMQYTLYPAAGGAPIVMKGPINCQGSFSLPLDPGTYDLEVEGYLDSEGTQKRWQSADGACDGLEVGDPGKKTYNCFVDRDDSSL